MLREVTKGEQFTILSRGKPVARITSIDSGNERQNALKEVLLSRLKTQEVTGARNWTRHELYDRENPEYAA